MGCGPADAELFRFSPGSGGGSKGEEKGQERKAPKAVAYIDGRAADCSGGGGRQGQFSPVRAGCGPGEEEKKDGDIRVMHVCG